MNEASDNLPMILQAPSVPMTQQRVQEARRLFHRTLASWASDVLILRHAKRHLIAWPADLDTSMHTPTGRAA